MRRRAAPPLLALALLAGCGEDERSARTPAPATAVRTAPDPAPAATVPTTPAPRPSNPDARLPLRDAERVLERHGYATLTARDFRPGQRLKVLLGIRRAPPRAELAFFFVGDRFIGTDTAQPSGAIEVVAQSDDRVTLAYGLYRPGDALCCASGGTAQVTYVWDGERLRPQDPIPTDDPDAPLGRR